MAKFEFYFNDTEMQYLFKYLQANNVDVIPDLLYDKSEFIKIGDYNLFKELQEVKTVHFFLVNETFQFEPLVLTKNRFIDSDKNFYINQRKGGPYIDLLWFRGYAEDAEIKLSRTEIDIYSRFIHYDSSDEFIATDKLKDVYRAVIRFVKNLSKPITLNNKKYWVGVENLKNIDID